MKSIRMHAYVNDSDEAALFYEKAFGIEISRSAVNDDGTYSLCEFDFGNAVFSIAEANHETDRGDKMQFCIQYGADEKTALKKAYETLSESADIDYPLEKRDFSTMAASLTDKYGIRWLLYI
ncbi:MAG: VOC family protein [Eubacteriales bacterium]|nr:VOC family protein [Eubacteriales bacterium]MDD3881946.1 VOC family protein [Eubacteriales bacterium]MDD4513813.1 VOC family protein [Eubacteriales bacterium]